MNLTWKNILLTIREGKHLIPTTDDGTPLIAVNAPLFELMELLEALTSGYNDLVAANTIKDRRIEFLRKAAEAHFQSAKSTKNAKNSYHWVRVSERLPEESGYYYTYGSNLGIDSMIFSAKHKMFNVTDNSNDFSTAIAVTHWCEKPNAPDDIVSADPEEPVAEEEEV